jgi:hypothetical protein
MTRAKQQAIEIQRALLTGADPRSIPALVDRITTQMATQAFAMKGDMHYMTFPDMTRAQIRTTASGAITGRGPGIHSAINIDVSGFDRNLKTAFGINGTQAVNFMNFDMEDGRMLIDGVNAHLYHHALGTFDLDDKALNLPLMFKDANGKNRLAFMTMRQPTGFQERIFSRTDLSKKENVANILKSRTDDYLELFDAANDPLNTMNLSADDREILNQVRQSMVDAKGDKKLKGKIQVRGADVDSADVEDLLIRVRSSQAAKNMKFEGFMNMHEYDLAEMASSKSASELGLNKRVVDYASNTKVSLADMQIGLGRATDAEPYYTRGSVFNILFEGAGLDIDEKAAQKFSQLQGVNLSTRQDVINYINGLSGVDKDVAQINEKAALDQVLQEISISSVPDPSNSLGLYINRQGFAVSMQTQVEDVLQSFRGSGKMIDLLDDSGNTLANVGLEDFYRLKYSVGLIPPSNAVDMVKELIAGSDDPLAAVQKIAGGRIMQQEEMTEILRGIQMFQSFSDVADQDTQAKIIAELISKYAKIDPSDPSKMLINLATAGEGAVESISEGTGFMRGIQILRGDAFDGLAAFDPALLDPTHPGARIKSSEELQKIRTNVLTGYQEALRTATPGSAAEARLLQEIQDLENANEAEVLSKLTLQQGSDAYNKYAVTSRYFDISKKKKDVLEGTMSKIYRAAVNNEMTFAPTPRAEYVQYTDEIAESLRGVFQTIRNLDEARSYTPDAEDLLKVMHKTDLSTRIYEMMSALSNAKAATNILDVFDTMEASIRNKFGARSAQVMREAIFKEGAPDSLRI